jgi:putative N6-adenine-specific DNA methylase
MSRFFVSCQPHLEKDLLFEMESFWHLLIDLDGLPTRSRPEVIYEDVGGLEIECETHLGFQINLFSKLANRVLWRIHHFEARYFDQFEKELKKIDLKKYFGEQKFNLNIESSKSRLFHESNLEESAYKILKNAVQKQDDTLLSLYVRLFKDNVTLSVDTSGKHLHKRGYRVAQGEAPIRETLAAKMYNFLLKNALDGQVPYSPQNCNTTLLDPFCGAGTLLFEAASFFQPNLVSKFDFERFNNLPGLLKSETWKKNFKIANPSKTQFMGVELDPKTFAKLEVNQQAFKTHFPSVEKSLSFIQGNSQTTDFTSLKDQSVFVIANPPYGERLRNNDAESVLTSLERIPGLKGLVVVHPAAWTLKFSQLKIKQSESFNNQGLELKLTLFAL